MTASDAPTPAPAGPTTDAAESPARTLLRVFVVALQLGAAVLLVRAYELETRAFFRLLVLMAVAYPVHALLPARWRLPAFALLSAGGLFLVLDPDHALFLLAAGGGLIALCHVPTAWPPRIGLLLAAAAVLVLARARVIPAPVPPGLWPLLGSFFMFRLALYVHALRHADAPTGFWRAVAYFFMLPNVAFPLFPVVDYKAFVKGHDAAPAFHTTERGLRWILRGIVHLLCYRLAYYHLSLDGVDVRTLGELVQAVVSTFLLYLRVSGQFHLIVGLLHLFGFHLPETHHLYYLSRGYTDLWRRINLYWTDFMMKLVYYPSFFRLRRFGQTRALLLSTAVVFIVTWLLHAWQTFWLLGAPHFTAPDALFWGILASLVIATTLYEKGRVRRAERGRWRPGRAAAVVGTFLGMSVLWSLWSSESVGEWASMFVAAGTTTPREVAVLAGLLLAFGAVAGWPWGVAALAAGPPAGPALGRQLRDAAVRLACVGALLALARPAVQARLPGVTRDLARSLRQHQLNARDEALLQRGYYEQLNAAGRLGGELWDLVAQRPRTWRAELGATDAWQPRDDLLVGELKPRQSLAYKGQPFSTNRWGMRDDDVTIERPAGTLRVALLGPSLVMGYGVGDSAVLDRPLERMLADAAGPGVRAEVLNFGVEGHSLTQQLVTLEEKVLRFRPHIVLFTVSPIEHRLAAEHLRRALARGARLQYDTIAAIVRMTGLTATTSHAGVIRGLRRWDTDIQRWALAALAARTREAGAVPVVLALRMPTQHRGRLAFSADLARGAGLPVLDLADAYAGRDEDSLRVAPWDRHPNPEAHRLLAAAIADGLSRAGLVPRISTADSTPGGVIR